MLVEVRPIYVSGKELTQKTRGEQPPVLGRLTFHEERIAHIGRTVRVARIKDDTELLLLSKLPQLYDAVVEHIKDGRMRIRGVEESDSRLFAQCWDITIKSL